MHILYVSDGKAGHRSQALGLFKAMQKQTNIDLTFEEISIDHLPLLSLLTAYKKQKHAAVSQPPDYIFGVGSHTQLRVFLMGKVFPQAKTVILIILEKMLYLEPFLIAVCLPQPMLWANTDKPAFIQFEHLQGRAWDYLRPPPYTICCFQV